MTDNRGMSDSLHDITVTYYNTDDGIHLNCSCGWDHEAGWDPTIAYLAQVEKDHLANPVVEMQEPVKHGEAGAVYFTDPNTYPDCDPDCKTRTACTLVGGVGHFQCGVCEDHRISRHHCGWSCW